MVCLKMVVVRYGKGRLGSTAKNILEKVIGILIIEEIGRYNIGKGAIE